MSTIEICCQCSPSDEQKVKIVSDYARQWIAKSAVAAAGAGQLPKAALAAIVMCCLATACNRQLRWPMMKPWEKSVVIPTILCTVANKTASANVSALSPTVAVVGIERWWPER